MADNKWDVFISYAHADAEWVRVLAYNLHQLGGEVFIDDWEITGGDVLVHRLDEGILNSRAGILVVTPTALSRPWVLQEYAAMLQRAVEGKQRLIPVLLADAEIPPLLATYAYIDFRNAIGFEYEKRLRKLLDALHGKPSARPPRTGDLLQPPGMKVRAEGPIHHTLRIGKDRVEFLGGWKAVHHRPRGMSHDLGMRVWELDRYRSRRVSDPRASTKDPQEARRASEAVLLRAGEALTKAFLEGEAGDVLSAAVKQATSQNASLRLALDITDSELADLPWETLRLMEPGGIMGPPLVLHRNVDLHRVVGDLGPMPVMQIRGPLRILVAVASPEENNERGELLDYERELRVILDAVESTRKEGGAYVHVLESGSLRAIHEELERTRYHVLHVSCHGARGRLLLETDTGREDSVTAKRFCEQVMVPDAGVPLVVLAGCMTALGDSSSEEGLPAIARGLLERGVPAVVAMQASVSDRYATDFAGKLYRKLATLGETIPLVAFSRARREVEEDRKEPGSDAAAASVAEWATPSLYLRGPSLPLFDPRGESEEIKRPEEISLVDGVCVRGVGDFVGRRQELREVLRVLRGGDRSGVLLHGIGGVGKSTLAARAASQLVEDGWIATSVTGATSAGALIAELGERLRLVCLERDLSEGDPLRQAALGLKAPTLKWQDALPLMNFVFQREKVVFLIDNFEDNLDEEHGLKLGQLADFLSAWLRQPGDSRVVITSRNPFDLPKRGHTRLHNLQLGPLSPAETRKLIMRLPGLDALEGKEKLRAYQIVGGHPRALEYLDALLRGGKGRFQDITDRIEDALEARGVKDASRWCEATEGDLDRALAETITLAADDVLLDKLLEQVESVPLAKELLIGACVYRVPVGRLGLVWQVGEIPEEAEKTDERAMTLAEIMARLQAPGGGLSVEDALRQHPGVQELIRPPVEAPEGVGEALERLLNLTLISPVRGVVGGELHFMVDRWTETALTERLGQEVVAAAHLRAARYWYWRARLLSHDLDDQLEARYHFLESGNREKALEITASVCSVLDRTGFWQREYDLCMDTLMWVEEGTQKKAAFLHQLGIVAQQRGSYDEALDWYKKSLAIEEELGDRSGMASSYHQLGNVAYLCGSYDEALDWYKKSLAIVEELGDRSGMARSHGQLGVLHVTLDHTEEAVAYFLRSLSLHADLQERAGLGLDLRWLKRQQKSLGEERFRRIVEKEVGKEHVGAILKLLDRMPVPEEESE